MPKLRDVKNSVVTSFAFDRNKLDLFDRLYPGVRSVFFRRCLDFVLESQDNFDMIFFNRPCEVDK